jgi:hypothetical protein
MERERAELQQETTYTPICHEPLLLWLGHTDEPYRTFSNSCPAQKLFTPAALHPTFRDSPFPEFVWLRSLDRAIGFAVVISMGKSVLPLDGNLTSPKLLMAMMATRRKTTSCQENKKINYTLTYQHGQRYTRKSQGNFLRLLIILNMESNSSWNYLVGDHLRSAFFCAW